MKKYYFTEANIKKSISVLLKKMALKELTSLQITVLHGSIVLPGGAFIYGKNIVVSLNNNVLSINRQDRHETPYEYSLDDIITLQWIKHHRIRIPEDV